MTTAHDHLPFAHGDLTRDIIGAFFDVYNRLGYGFVESVYANAMPIALAKRGLRADRERMLTVRYEGAVMGEFRADLIVADTILVELKAVEHIGAAHERQLLNYLRASSLTVGLILNFGPKATQRRIVWTGTSGQLSDLTADSNR